MRRPKTRVLVEYAKTSRSTCKKCNVKIEGLELRVTFLLQIGWYHAECFFMMRRSKLITSVQCYNAIEDEDKVRIQDLVERNTGLVMAVELRARPGTSSNLLQLRNFTIEYSKADRVRAVERNMLGYTAGGENLPGFYDLTARDQFIVKNKIKPIPRNELPEREVEMNVENEKQAPPPECDDMGELSREIPIPPLKNLQFFIYGDTESPKEQVKTRIQQLGGQITNKLTEAHAAVVSTEEDVEKQDTQMSQIRKSRIKVVTESFFYLIQPAGTIAEALELIKANNIAPSILPKPVQNLIMKIFDIELMKRTLQEYPLDMEKIHKMTKKNVMTAFIILAELRVMINEDTSDRVARIVDSTNRFLANIPHIANQPILENTELLKQKTDMLENLQDIQVVMNLLKTEGDTPTPIDHFYEALNADITPLYKERHNEYNMILEYVNSTHAAENSNYTLEVEQVFKVVRKGEEESYRQCRIFKNCRLLWHGSRMCNTVGILTQGLRVVPPPEGRSRRSTFGKGIHFSDMVTQAANACRASPDNPTGIVFLCEVALGSMHNCTDAESVTGLEPKHQSVWVKGRMQPDPAFNRTLPDGTIVPLGRPIPFDETSNQLSNNFIIYFMDQVNIKYLIQLKLNFEA